ncbi:DUF433 domain-containing protein [Candidatus Bathyarchaeota archaeon]|nr:DUF433 domain-containing protein [Candidatus Bathyarchaeota archaeon]
MKKDWRERIVIDEEILSGKPVIKNTRISVEFILELLGNGWTYEQVLDNYPQLRRGDIEAALRYAAEVLQDELVYPYP